MNKTLVKYGIIGGLLATILFLGPIVLSPEKYMDPEQMAHGEVIGYSVMVISMLSVFFGMRAYRKKLDGKSFSFLKALGVGLQITVITCLLFYLGNILLYEVISPNFLKQFGDHYKDYLLQSATSESEKSQVLKEFNQNAGVLENSYLYALIMSGTTLFIGIIISLISAMSLKRSAL